MGEGCIKNGQKNSDVFYGRPLGWILITWQILICSSPICKFITLNEILNLLLFLVCYFADFMKNLQQSCDIGNAVNVDILIL